MMRCFYSPLTRLAFASQIFHGRPASRTTTLIPRVVVPAVKTLAFKADGVMDWRRRLREDQQQQANNKVYNGNTANYGTGDTELHIAIRNGEIAKVRHLVERHPQASYALNRLNISPLYLAVERQYTDLVDYMLRNLKGDRNVTPNLMMQGKSIIHAAIAVQNQEMVKLILKHQPKLIDRHDEKGQTPLSYAAFNGNVVIVSYLLKNFKQASNTPDADGSLPIHKACLGGSIDVLKLFYSRSHKSVLMVNTRRRTILHLAAKEPRNRLQNVVIYLLSLPEGKQLVKMRDLNEIYPLELATQSGNQAVADIIRGSHR